MEKEAVKENEAIQNQEEQLISDFSNMFKKGATLGKKPVLGSCKNVQGNTQTKSPNWLLQIPAKLDIKVKDLHQRKVLDTRRWTSVIKSPDQDIQKKIIAAVGSVWNYLCSSNGVKDAQPLNFRKVYQLIKSDDQLLINENNVKEITMSKIESLFQKLNTKILSKVLMEWQNGKTINQNEQIKDKQLQLLLQGLQLRNTDRSYIYLSCSNEVFLPIGWQKTPLKQIDAYKKLEQIRGEDQQLWIINSSVLKFDDTFQIKRWRDVKKDLTTPWPEYFDIRNIKKGVMRRPEATQENQKEERGNKCCIIEIQIAQ